MVDGVIPMPVVMRRKGEHPGDKTKYIIGGAKTEVGAVTAIVKDNEDKHQNASARIESGTSSH